MNKIKKLFVSWIPESKGSSRTKFLAKCIGFEIFRFPLFTRKIFLAPLKFPVQIIVTLFYLMKIKPDIIIVEMVQPIIGLTSLLYKIIFKKPLIIDLHSGPLVSRKWAFLKTLTYFILKKSNLIIIHEKTIYEKLPCKGGKKVIVVHDPPLNIKDIQKFQNKKDYFVFPCSGDTDEPIKEVIKGAVFYPDIDFFITGALKKVFLNIPENVKFTGFLPQEQFYSLLKSSKGIIALTNWDYTLLFAGFEAVSFEKPLIVSNKKTLREFFKENAIYVDNEPDSIRKGIEKLLKNYEWYLKKMREFKKSYIRMWEKEIKDLKERLIFFEKTF